MKPNGSLTLLLLKKNPSSSRGLTPSLPAPKKLKANEAKKFQIESIEIHRAKCNVKFLRLWQQLNTTC